MVYKMLGKVLRIRKWEILISPTFNNNHFKFSSKMQPENKQKNPKTKQNEPKKEGFHITDNNPYKGTDYRFYDIAANLTDGQFTGDYGKHHHADDRSSVIERAKQVGCHHLLIAAGNLEDAHLSHQMCQQYDNCYATIGVHPCRASEPFNTDKYPTVDHYFQQIEAAIQKMQDPANRVNGHLVAIGECGLDYDRLEWSSKEQQLEVFPRHFELARKYKLPMYLHNRNTGSDFYDIVEKNRHMFSTGVVHSFTGSKQELEKILALDLHVGINGCSLKTAENLEVLKLVPVDRMMIETDSPYCEIRNSHASMSMVRTKFAAKAKEKKGAQDLVKGRNQPCKIVEVLEVISAVLGRDPKELSKILFENSLRILGSLIEPAQLQTQEREKEEVKKQTKNEAKVQEQQQKGEGKFIQK